MSIEWMLLNRCEKETPFPAIMVEVFAR